MTSTIAANVDPTARAAESSRHPDCESYIMQISDVRIHEIEVSVRIRPLNRDYVAELKTSIGNVGLLNPISVYARADGTMTLTTGAHRLQAAKELGWESIPAILLHGSDIDRELAEIDENLCRLELGPAERAFQESRRKELWLTKRAIDVAQQGSDAGSVVDTDAEEMGGTICVTHPSQSQDETASRGGIHTTARDAVGRRKSPQQQLGYAASTAAVTGEPKFSVNRNTRRGDELGATLLDIAGTSLDKGVELDALVKLESGERAELTARAKAGERVSARTALEAKSQSPKTHNKGLARRAIAALEKCSDVMDEREFSAALKGVVVPETVARLAFVIGSCAGGESGPGDEG